MNKLLIIGAGGHAKVCLDIANLLGYWNTIEFLDDNENKKYFQDNKIIDKIYNYENYINDYEFIVAIGNNEIRKKIMQDLSKSKARIISLIHPSAIISKDVIIGVGCSICANAVINPSTIIEDGVILNTNCVIEHDNHIKSYSHISPSATLSGNVIVGESTWIGANATIINNINISAHIVVGAGSVVIRNLLKEGTYVGSPASLLK